MPKCYYIKPMKRNVPISEYYSVDMDYPEDSDRMNVLRREAMELMPVPYESPLANVIDECIASLSETVRCCGEHGIEAAVEYIKCIKERMPYYEDVSRYLSDFKKRKTATILEEDYRDVRFNEVDRVCLYYTALAKMYMEYGIAVDKYAYHCATLLSDDARVLFRPLFNHIIDVANAAEDCTPESVFLSERFHERSGIESESRLYFELFGKMSQKDRKFYMETRWHYRLIELLVANTIPVRKVLLDNIPKETAKLLAEAAGFLEWFETEKLDMALRWDIVDMMLIGSNE